jgi:hypothetical protein
MASPDRFFSATVIAGRLHILGLAQGGPWAPARFEWRDGPGVEVLLNPKAGDRKVTSREELQAVVRAPAGTVRARFLWIREDLVDEARRLWETGAGVNSGDGPTDDGP